MLHSLISNFSFFLQRVVNSAFIWSAWLIVPFVMEFIPSVRSIFLIKRRKRQRQKINTNLSYFPEITLIIPVYNSGDALYNVIRSISESTYPNSAMRILLVDNKGNEEDFKIFSKAQMDFQTLNMEWLSSEQGKSRALNMAVYNSSGTIIINVDSDGYFEKSAISRIVSKFLAQPDIKCMTGSILTSPNQIETANDGVFLKLLRRLEFYEYAQAFLAGRSSAAEDNNIYTLSGAFSAFTREALLSSQMYNTDTICEDTQMTFQVKQKLGCKVEIAENAIFFVEPIEGFDKLYVQRQRWQRGSLEVGKMFFESFKLSHFFKDINVYTLLYDHTFAFPRLAWYVVILYFLFSGKSVKILLFTALIIYLSYVFTGYLYFFTVKDVLSGVEEKEYYLKHRFLIWLLPMFNFLIFFVRLCGVINSINTAGCWKTKNLSEEMSDIKEIISNDFKLKNIHKKFCNIKNQDRNQDKN